MSPQRDERQYVNQQKHDYKGRLLLETFQENERSSVIKDSSNSLPVNNRPIIFIELREVRARFANLVIDSILVDRYS